ncbi:MAG: hypothetical protein WC852_06575 [Candidatus Nanoarchaeia archaeon]|jgi:hypothetical protein
MGKLRELLEAVENNPGAAIGLGFLLCAGGFGTCAVVNNTINPPRYELQVKDINLNGIPDKFYTINGDMAVIELDGKPIATYHLLNVEQNQ